MSDDEVVTVPPGGERQRRQPRILAALAHQREAIGVLNESVAETHWQLRGIHRAIKDGETETNNLLRSIEGKLDQALAKIPAIEARLDALDGGASTNGARV